MKHTAPGERWTIGLRIQRHRIRDYLYFRSSSFRLALLLFYCLAYLAAVARRDPVRRLQTLSTLWRRVDSRATDLLTRAALPLIAGERERSVSVGNSPWWLAAASVLATSQQSPTDLQKFRTAVTEGRQTFDGRLLILAAPSPDEKGTIIVKFTPYFAYFAALFAEDIFRDYHLVLEPSWVGYFDPNILLLGDAPHPVFVETVENRDFDFLQSLGSSLRPIRLAANHWTDPRVFHPIEGTTKDFDLSVISIWADFKRHYALFKALADTGRHDITAACIGMPYPRTQQSIAEEAEYFGVGAQVQYFENLAAPDVNTVLNRSKAHLILSRKEGANKALVEAMAAGIPSFLPLGFNYGTRYPYVNSRTGGFYAEHDLPQLMCEIADGRSTGDDPRGYFLEHLTPQRSTEFLERCIYGSVNGRLAVKVNRPELQYYDSADSERLAPAYAQLRRYLRQ